MTAKTKREREALIVIDMLNDFVTGALKCDRAGPIIPKIARLIEAARTAGIPVVYSCDAHSRDDHEIRVAWQPHAMAGTAGAQIVTELAPTPGDHISPKTTYSGFYRTDLDEFLTTRGVKTVILTGVLTNCCIQYIAGEAFVRGYRVVVPADCVAAFTPKEHNDALAYIKFWFKADVTDSKTLVRSFSQKGRDCTG